MMQTTFGQGTKEDYQAARSAGVAGVRFLSGSFMSCFGSRLL